MDNMELTKIVGGLCGALLVLLLISWGGEILYHTGGGGHGDEKHASAYPIEVDETGSTETAEEGPSLEELLAAADPEKGAKVFSKCKACHKLEAGANGTGPSLFAVVDKPIATEAGFSYSTAMAGLEGNWDAEALDGFLAKPNSYVKGTKMSFAGLKKAKDRANLIAYLQTVQ